MGKGKEEEIRGGKREGQEGKEGRVGKERGERGKGGGGEGKERKRPERRENRFDFIEYMLEKRYIKCMKNLKIHKRRIYCLNREFSFTNKLQNKTKL